MVQAGNPNFVVSIQCLSTDKCETYAKSRTPGVNCGQIAVLEDKIYCKRSHPGIVKLPREKAEVEQLNRRLLAAYINKLIKDPRLKKLFNTKMFDTDLKTLFFPASSIVEKQHEELEKENVRSNEPENF